jgi:6-pyruvoyltetrahydropterin 2'-reductase
VTEKTFKYSEIFHSFQGEGNYTGVQTAWIRFFLCNLQCDGFGQKDPTDKSTYILPYTDFDVSSVERIEDLPVWEYGCDSSYTWAKKYRHLAHDENAVQICDNLENVFKHETNPQGKFLHPHSGQYTHLAFTGGEPMLNQQAMVEILHCFRRRKNFPNYVTVETNGTKPFKKYYLDDLIMAAYSGWDNREWFWSCSPKLFSTSGELAKKAIKPEFVATYAEASNHGQLKYVVNGTPQSWDEVEQHTEAFRAAGVDWDVWIMPVGATKEQQQDPQIAEIAVEAIQRGYHVSGRLHCYIFGNKIGT